MEDDLNARLQVYDKSQSQSLIEDIYSQLGGRLEVSALASCPVEFTSAFVNLTATQSCGKCTPCRVGLKQLGLLLDTVLDGTANLKVLDTIAALAEDIFYSADCAIGYEAAALALKAVKGFRDDFEHHITLKTCGAGDISSVPCRSGCPADVDVPGYLALIAEGKYTEAVALIRKDNPLAVVCGLVCEHPCELYCRRGMVDDPINIRGLKRFAADNAGEPIVPARAEATGKSVAVVGGGAAGLTAAYYLALMGHSPVIYESREQLGGMLRYGIPSYRLPRKQLNAEIEFLLERGIEAKCGVAVGKDISLDELKQTHDAVFLAIGAHGDNKLGIAGEDADGVISAVQLLRDMGDGHEPDFTGKKVVVVGGGNVAMDVARTALRLSAKHVQIAYRRRAADMTAQQEEIHAAIAEGCELTDLHAPVRVAVGADGKVEGLVVQPQIISTIKSGRASIKKADVPELTLECDISLVAIGQSTESADCAAEGLPVKRDRLVGQDDTAIDGFEGLFVGGECVTGPATVIRAVSGGKAAAAAIDSYLGYDHRISVDAKVPQAFFRGRMYCARSNTKELSLHELESEFAQVEVGLYHDEALQEATRCLRCDHFGKGSFRGGRSQSW
jgi:NADPH-dependent glutamate synthase beta subunit-like oxidoreductase